MGRLPRGFISIFRSIRPCASRASSSTSPARRSAAGIFSTTPRPRRRRPSSAESRGCTTPRVADLAGVERLLEPILSLHERIRASVLDACARQGEASEQLATVAADDGGGGDTTYAIDRVGEEALVRGLADLAREEPLCIVA